MQRAIEFLITIFVTICVTAPAYTADKTGTRAILKVRTQIESDNHRSSRGTTLIYTVNEEDIPRVDLGSYQIEVLISDIEAKYLVIDLTLQDKTGVPLNVAQVLVPLKSESAFNLSTAEVSVTGTIGVAELIYPVQSEEQFFWKIAALAARARRCANYLTRPALRRRSRRSTSSADVHRTSHCRFQTQPIR